MINTEPGDCISGTGSFPIDRNSEGFHLITRIQDEAHRFAIEYHRLLRSKGQVHSVLDDIPGIGPRAEKGADGAAIRAWKKYGRRRWRS